MPARSKSRIGSAPERPLRYSVTDAAEKLRLHYDTVLDLITRGIFTVIAPNGRGRRKNIFLHPDEVELYATSDAESVREYRIRKGRLKPRS